MVDERFYQVVLGAALAKEIRIAESEGQVVERGGCGEEAAKLMTSLDLDQELLLTELESSVNPLPV